MMPHPVGGPISAWHALCCQGHARRDRHGGVSRLLEGRMIERFDPFGRMLSLRQMMDRLMEDAVVMPREGQAGGMGSMAMDVFEEGDNLVVETPMPGMRPEDVDVNIERGILTIRGEMRREDERKERNYLIREQRRGSFSRTLQLPSTVDTEACQATYEHGVLRLVFPKSEAAKPRRIQVSSGAIEGRQAIPTSTEGNGGRTTKGGAESSGSTTGRRTSKAGTTGRSQGI
jgi:HSP20 family protein